MAGAAGDLSLVDTGTTGELQFFVPALHLELFEGSRSGGGGVRSLLEPYSQDFFLAPDCQNLRIEGFYEPFSRSLVLPNEGFIGLESTLIQEEK